MFRAIFIALILAFFAFPRGVFAATVEPPIVEIQLAPGMVKDGNIHVTDDASGVSYTAEIQKFSADGEDGRQAFFPVSDISDPVGWIHVQKSDSAQNVYSYHVTVPSSARAGGYMAAVFFSPVGIDQAGPAVRARVGVLFLIHVTGKLVHDVRLFSCDAVTTHKDSLFGATLFSSFPTQFVTRIQNAGDDIVSVSGTIAVTDLFGRNIRTFDVNDLGGRALPHSFRQYVTNWPWNVQPFAFGRYVVSCRVISATGDEPQLQEFSFWVLPWKVVVAFSAIALFVILLITRYTYRRRV